MYTQCPDCTTVFRVSADALRAAQGDVRCGVCSTTFNALENLSEEPFRPTGDGWGTGAPEDTITVEEMPGTEVIELSTTDETLAANEPPAGEAPAATDTAGEHPVADAALTGEPSLEFDGNADDLDRLFVEMPATDFREMAATARSGEADGAATHAPADDTLDRTDEFPILVLDEQDEPEAHDSRPEPFEAPRFLIPEEMRKGLAQEAAASAAAVHAFEEPASMAHPHRWPWMLGIVVLALVLAAQVVHTQRDQLIHRPDIGPTLAQLYALVGFPFAVPTDLSAYELRQWGATSDAMQPGRLRLRASIVNRAAYAQPYPLLRLALQDRFGATVGVRDIEPADYLPGASVAKLLDPGQRADAEIRIVDPGHDAVGFEMDVCLPSAEGVRCANEARPAAP